MRHAALAAALLLAASATHAQTINGPQPTIELNFSIGAVPTIVEAAKQRNWLRIDNESTSNAIAVCFVAGCIPALNTAGSYTIQPQSSASAINWREWSASKVPGGPITIIAAGASTPVSIEE